MRGGRAIAAVFALATLLVTSTSAAHDMRVLGRADGARGHRARHLHAEP